MIKIKLFWVIGIFTLVFCGQLGTSSSEQRPIDEILFDPSVPTEIKARFQEKIDADHILLDNLLERIEGMSDEDLKALIPDIRKEFAETYLKDPLNRQSGGQGWENVIFDLRDIAGHAAISKRISVRLHYIPYIEGNTLEEDIDFKAIIRLKLSGSPDVEAEGCLLHRRTCTPIECE